VRDNISRTECLDVLVKQIDHLVDQANAVELLQPLVRRRVDRSVCVFDESCSHFARHLL